MPDHLTAKDLETVKKEVNDRLMRAGLPEHHEVTAALSRLVAFAEKHPVTADGVFVAPDMELWAPDGDRHEVWVLSSDNGRWEPQRDNGDTLISSLWYSSMSAAAAAREGRE